MKCSGLTQKYKPCTRKVTNGKYCSLHAPNVVPAISLIDIMMIPRIATTVVKYLTIRDDISIHGVIVSIPATWIRLHDLMFTYDCTSSLQKKNVGMGMSMSMGMGMGADDMSVNNIHAGTNCDRAKWCMERIAYYLNPPLGQLICELFPGISCKKVTKIAEIIAPIFRRIMFRPAVRYIRDVMNILPPAIYTDGVYSPRNSDNVYYLHTSIIEDHINDYNKDRLLYHLVIALLRDINSLNDVRC